MQAIGITNNGFVIPGLPGEMMMVLPVAPPGNRGFVCPYNLWQDPGFQRSKCMGRIVPFL